MAAHNHLCHYRDVADVIQAHPNDFPPLPDNGIYTGHHLIPDHCFYHTSGLRGMGDPDAFLCVPRYHTLDAPVIIVTADANGGKWAEHKAIHDTFDGFEGGLYTCSPVELRSSPCCGDRKRREGPPRCRSTAS